MTTKADIAKHIQEATGLKKPEAAEVTDKVLQHICDTLIAGEEVKISGFGHFMLREKSARMGRNPRTGEAAEIDARSVVVFRPSHLLKKAVQV